MIGIIAYGAGNIASVCNALDRLGSPWLPVQQPEQLSAVDRLILPGVGHFGTLMQSLAESNLDTAIQQWVESGKPVLGICLGMQALFEGSEEAPGVAGLGLIPGQVRRFPLESRCPHMGWNTVAEAGRPEVWMYFAHSYYASVGPSTAATTEQGFTFSSIVRVGSATGFQFHPERSSVAGAHRLKEWIQDAR